MQKTVFIDRDGVVNRRLIGDWVKVWSEFEVLEGVSKAIRLLKDVGFRVVLITNQRCLALGLIDRADLDEIHAQMNRQLEEQSGACFDDIFVCPHDRDDGCDCRKPRPGMFLQAVSKYPDIELSQCVMFGDSDSDEGAAQAAGCKGFYRIDESKSLFDQVKVYLGL
jgi:D-glycero-D-manno-heptose 1,7-bisphosphate phosphatase